jgi:hypothetical protein
MHKDKQMEMDSLGPDRKRRRVEKEASPSQPMCCSSAAEEEQQRRSTAADETQQQEPEEKGGGQVEQEAASLINNNEEEKGDEEDTWLVVRTAQEGSLSSIDSDGWSVVEAACAGWCRVLDDNSYQWDDTKVKCFLSQEERNDLLLVRNLVHGTIVSAQMYPLIFETSTEEDNELVRLRSLSFFEQLLADGENDESKYRSLSSDQKRIVAVGVRDLFLGAWHGVLNERKKRILDGMVKMLDEKVGCTQARGMNISFHPSANFKVVKLIEALDEAVGHEWAPFFAQVMDTPKLFAVFVDPAELSFHNFENIVPLDRWIEWKLEDERDGGLSLSLADAHLVQADREVLTCKLRGAACDLVEQLSSLDLYLAPLNKATRGGERFIFHSALLSKALSEGVRSGGVLSKLAQGRLASSFEFVNYIFRCNRFASGHAMFASHLDTPYYDNARSQVSKYTLLIYLTAGRSEPVLRVDDVELNEIEEMTCVIFDQSYEHEGRPFMDSDKIFIRSELVFKDKELGHNSQIASLFSEACYMTGQSVLEEDLASYAHECFERANSLHWAIEREATQPPVYLHKQFHGMHFVTNGYDYWFSKGNVVNVVDCGMVAVLDYFNCKIDGQPFRSLCHTTTVRERFRNTDDILAHLRSGKKETAEALRRLKETDVESLIKKRPDKPFVKRPDPYGCFEDEDEHVPCCPFHCYTTFDAWRDEYVQSNYETCCNYTRRKLFGVPLLVLNQELVIYESNLKIVGDKMFFLKGSNDKALPPINFAACWNSVEWHEFIDVDQEISAPQLLIPPIMLHEFDQGYHLVLDFFRNDWMVRVDDEHTIPVPIISNELSEATEDESPFLSRVRPHWSDLDELLEISEDSDDSDKEQ